MIEVQPGEQFKIDIPTPYAPQIRISNNAQSAVAKLAVVHVHDTVYYHIIVDDREGKSPDFLLPTELTQVPTKELIAELFRRFES